MWICCGIKWIPELTLVQQIQAWAEQVCNTMSMVTGPKKPMSEMKRLGKSTLGYLVVLLLLGILAILHFQSVYIQPCTD